MNEQLAFLREGQFLLLEKLAPDTPANWGVMNAQQMTEHVRDFFNISSEKVKMELLTPQEHLPKYIEFLYSDKAFRENTKAPESILGKEGLPLRQPDLATAKAKLNDSVNDFIDYFKNDPEIKTMHPVFGPLNFEQWVRLHHKHVMHHLRQFGLVERR